jgi:2-oxoglutarate/2-oxoacid ferredoxin oxidoreductase subunit alpha
VSKVLMKGNEAIGEAALRAGCRYFFGYPITPQNELPHYMSKKLPQLGGVYLQAESEVSAINMVYGAAGAGGRVMTSSSSPGISLKQEGISYIAGAELPCVIVNIMRCGPGIAGIQPAQSDYFQSTRGGGHGDYRLVTYAPASVQEMFDLTYKAFDVADAYRNPVLIMGDGVLGQMMEPVEIRDLPANHVDKPWVTTGCQGRKPNLISSLHIIPEDLHNHNCKLQAKYDEISQKEIMWEEYKTEDAEIVLVSYGTSARISKAAVDLARAEGINAGLVRPITVWPYPYHVLDKLADTAQNFLTVEMNMGQMLEDVRLGVNGKKPVHFHGRCGGVIPKVREIYQDIVKISRGGDQ